MPRQGKDLIMDLILADGLPTERHQGRSVALPNLLETESPAPALGGANFRSL